MVLSGALQWWEQWQLRVLILVSLLLQFFLHLSAYVRRLHVLRRFRALVWVAYISSDALAIYALATLFNRHRQQQQPTNAGSTGLEIIWAPVLLVHLGGQPNISAYSLEDNELWKRHVITVAAQVSVAVYVFCKWWSGEGSLLIAAVLLFVIGMIKFGHKPWALKSASFNSMLRASTAALHRREKRSSGIAAWWRRCTSFYVDVALAMEEGEEEEECTLSLEKYVTQANEQLAAASSCSDQEPPATHQDGKKVISTIHPGYIYRMFVDLPTPYCGRVSELRYFLQLGDAAYDMLQQSLRYTFGLMYTKRRSTITTAGMSVLILLPFLALNALLLFVVSDKEGYNENDVLVTYILLCSILAQELSPYLEILLYKPFLGRFLINWHDMVYQHRFLSFCARRRKPTVLMSLAISTSLMESVNKHWYIWQEPAARQISRLVRGHVKDGWQRYIRAKTYRRFSNLRGHRTLRKQHQLEELGWSLNLPFDKTVLLWHIATDLCFYYPQRQPQPEASPKALFGNCNSEGISAFFRRELSPSPDVEIKNSEFYTRFCSFLTGIRFPGISTPNSQTSPKGKGDATQRSREISNYMVYLLFIHPEMLMPGTRPGLFLAASDEIDLLLKLKDSTAMLGEEQLKDSTSMLGEEQTLAREIFDTAKPPASSADVIPDACKLAKALMELGNKQRWMLIQGVWMEMLCYSASRCRGYLHAKSLGEGGEYLSTVWLLWSFMGMETLADRHQRPESPQEEEEKEEEEEEEEEEREDEEDEQAAESEEEDITESTDTSTSRSEVDQSAEDSPV